MDPIVANNVDNEKSSAISRISVYTSEKNRQKLQSTIDKTTISLMNPLRPNKKLLVVDLDHTILDFSNFEYDYINSDSAKLFKRPYCDQFLTMVYEDYDIVVWSQTHWRWLEVKLTELGLLAHPNFKIAFVLDNTTMFTVSTTEQTRTKTVEIKSEKSKEKEKHKEKEQKEPEMKKSKPEQPTNTQTSTQTQTTTTTTTSQTFETTNFGDIFMNIWQNVINTDTSNTNATPTSITNTSLTTSLSDILSKTLNNITNSNTNANSITTPPTNNEKIEISTDLTTHTTTTTKTTQDTNANNEKEKDNEKSNAIAIVQNNDNTREFSEMTDLLFTVLGDIVASLNSGVTLLSVSEKSKVKRKHRVKSEDGHEVKALEIIWSKFPQFSSKNTLHIDDLKRNFVLNPKNGILISPFRRESSNASRDEELLKLALYLKEIATSEDFSLIDHANWNSKK